MNEEGKLWLLDSGTNCFDTAIKLCLAMKIDEKQIINKVNNIFNQFSRIQVKLQFLRLTSHRVF